MTYFRYFIIVFVSMSAEYLFCQYPSLLPQDSPEIKWKIIKTENFDIIFPDVFESKAQHMANTLETVYSPISNELNIKPARIPVILHNQSAFFNAYVSLAPKRADLFMIPPQSSLLDGMDWEDLLSVHEFRHIVQFEKTKTGLTKLIFYLTGETGWLVTSFIAVPMWYWEGDAVGVETALLKGGRGRYPEFDLGTRTILLNDGIFPYEKGVLGSFKEYYPDHYQFGYLLTNAIKQKFGNEVWSKIISGTSQFPLRPFAFSHNIKKVTGYNLKTFYISSMFDLYKTWRKQQEGLIITPSISKSVRTNDVWTNYMFPRYLPDDRIIVKKYGLDDISSFVIIGPAGDEEVVFTPGDDFNIPFSSADNLLVWNEMTIDKRWWYRTYSTIKTYNIRTKEERILVKDSRLFSPSISPNMEQIVAVEFSENSQYSLVFIDASNGSEIFRIPSPDNNYISTPSWSNDSKSVVFIRTNEKGRTICLLNIQTGTFKNVIPYTIDAISHPSVYGKYIYYHSSYSGIDNIYVVDLNLDRIFQVTSRKYGAFNPVISYDGTKIVYNDYTVAGYDVVEMELNESKWIEMEKVVDRKIKYYETQSLQDIEIAMNDTIHGINYPVTDYTNPNKLHFHSWLPLISPIDNNVSFSMYSNDIMNSTLVSVGYVYNMLEKTKGSYFNLSFQRWYPVIDLEVKYGGRTSTYITDYEKLKFFSWEEKGVKFGARFPSYIYNGKYSQSKVFGIHSELIDIYNSTNNGKISNGKFISLIYDLSFTRIHKTTIRSLAPPLGQKLDIQYSHIVYGSENRGWLIFSDLKLFFPGFLKHHSFRPSLSYIQTGKKYRLSNGFTYPRGYYDRMDFYKFIKGSLNYAFPVGYPDLSFDPFLYFKRFKLNLFFDYGIRSDEIDSDHYRSIGLEFVSDMNFMRFVVPFEPGVRFSYISKTKKMGIELLLFGFGD